MQVGSTDVNIGDIVRAGNDYEFWNRVEVIELHDELSDVCCLIGPGFTGIIRDRGLVEKLCFTFDMVQSKEN